MTINSDNVGDRDSSSPCCGARITILLRQFTTVYGGEKIVWQCLRCGNIYVIGNREVKQS